MQFIDLGRQYEKIQDKVKDNINKVLDHKQFIMGPEVEKLEYRLAEYTKRRYAFACSSGTDALVIPLMAYGLTKKDAVFVPAFTFYATAESVNLAGGTPVFVDSNETYNMSPEELEKTICAVLKKGEYTPRGIIAVDLFGLPADYDKIIKIAGKYDLFLIEDGAQSFGAVYKGEKACKFGDVSATSFFPAKPLGCYGDGGAIFTDNDELAEKINSIRVHGQGENRYHNIRIGLNGRLDTMQAAILLAKLEIFDEEVKLRQRAAGFYNERLKDIMDIPIVPENCISAWGQYSLLAKTEKERDWIITQLKGKGIPVMVYYPIPLHKQPVYEEDNLDIALPVCEKYSKCIFSLPMHPYLTEKEIDSICSSLISSIKVIGA